MTANRDAVRAARLRRALEQVALVYSRYCAHELTAEAAAYRSGELAIGELMRGSGRGRR